MSRNGSGTYSIPNTFTSGTRVLSADVNANFSDLATALTGSLALDGQSAMTGQFKGAAGTVSAPGWSWANELGSGWYRAGSQDFRYAVAGADVLKVAAAGVTVTGTLTVSGTITGTLGLNSVVTASITDANVTTAKIANANVTPAKLSTGAPTWDASGNLSATGAVRAQIPGAATQGQVLLGSGSYRLYQNGSGAFDLNGSLDATALTQNGVSVPARPTSTSGSGQWVASTFSDGAAAVLPAGGTWAYVYFHISVTGVTADQGWFGTIASGVAAGGSTAMAGVSGYSWTGFVWRVN